MTPKEKADELFNKMYSLSTNAWFNTSKKCALIAVDEILKETKLHDKTIYEHGRTGYWKEVKNEINKL